jgi:hypothetical protein
MLGSSNRRRRRRNRKHCKLVIQTRRNPVREKKRKNRR